MPSVNKILIKIVISEPTVFEPKVKKWQKSKKSVNYCDKREQ